MRITSRIGMIFLTVVTCLTMPLAAHAVTLSFQQIVPNSDSNVASQLFVDVLDAGNGQVEFRFRNTGNVASSITDIYFDDGPFLGISSIANGPGVFFSRGAKPGDLPEGATIDFETTRGFSADTDSPVSINGVNPGEYVSISFKLAEGMTYEDVLLAIGSGELRIGIHVQAIGDSELSSSFVNTPLPEPGALLLLSFGLVGLAGFGVRRRAKK